MQTFSIMSLSWCCMFQWVSPSGWVSIFTQSWFKQPVIWLNGTKAGLTSSAQLCCRSAGFCVRLQMNSDENWIRCLSVPTSLYACFNFSYCTWLQRTSLWVDKILWSFDLNPVTFTIGRTPSPFFLWTCTHFITLAAPTP